jgi:hypothetical protein
MTKDLDRMLRPYRVLTMDRTIGESSALEIGFAEVGPAQFSTLEIRTLEIRAAEIGAPKISAV